MQHAVSQHDNATYRGWVAVDTLPVHFGAADVIYYGLRTDYPGAVYNAPNTLAQAMSAGRSLIANEVGDLGRILRDVNCGVLLQEVKPHK